MPNHRFDFAFSAYFIDFKPDSACPPWYQKWSKDGDILLALAMGLRDRGDLDLSEAFIDGTIASGKKEAGRGEYER